MSVRHSGVYPTITRGIERGKRTRIDAQETKRLLLFCQPSYVKEIVLYVVTYQYKVSSILAAFDSDFHLIKLVFHTLHNIDNKLLLVDNIRSGLRTVIILHYNANKYTS